MQYNVTVLQYYYNRIMNKQHNTNTKILFVMFLFLIDAETNSAHVEMFTAGIQNLVLHHKRTTTMMMMYLIWTENSLLFYLTSPPDLRSVLDLTRTWTMCWRTHAHQKLPLCWRVAHTSLSVQTQPESLLYVIFQVGSESIIRLTFSFISSGLNFCSVSVGS